MGDILWRGLEDECCSKQAAEQQFSAHKNKKVGKELTDHHLAQSANFPAKVEML